VVGAAESDPDLAISPKRCRALSPELFEKTSVGVIFLGVDSVNGIRLAGS